VSVSTAYTYSNHVARVLDEVLALARQRPRLFSQNQGQDLNETRSRGQQDWAITSFPGIASCFSSIVLVLYVLVGLAAMY